MTTKLLALSLVLMLVGITTSADGIPPTETLQKPMDEIIGILKTPNTVKKTKKRPSGRNSGRLCGDSLISGRCPNDR